MKSNKLIRYLKNKLIVMVFFSVLSGTATLITLFLKIENEMIHFLTLFVLVVIFILFYFEAKTTKKKLLRAAKSKLDM